MISNGCANKRFRLDLMRRTMLGLNVDLAIGDDESAAEIGKQYLVWSDQRAKDEVEEYRSEIERMRVGNLSGEKKPLP